MKNKICYLLFLCTIPVISCAQNEKVDASFTKEIPNPDFISMNLQWIGLNLAPGHTTIYNDITGQFKKGIFTANANYRIDWAYGFERLDKTIKANSALPYKSPKSYAFNTGVILSQKDGESKLHFNLKGGHNVQYYSKVPCKVKKFIMADLGFKKGFYSFLCTGKDLVFDVIGAQSGSVPPSPASVRTVFHYSMLRAGISMGSIGFAELDFDGIGKRSACRYTRFYADMLFLLGSQVNDISEPLYTQSNVVYAYNKYSLDGSPRSNVGMCFGVNSNIICGWGFDAGLEAGYFPGIKGSFGSNFILTFRSAITFGKILS